MPHVERRYGHHFKPLGLDIAGDVVEKLRRVAPGARLGGEKAEVGIDARRHRVIIAGAEVAIGAIPLPFAPHDHRQLGVRLPDRKSTRLNSSHSCAARMTSSACKKKTYQQISHSST